LKKSIAKIRFVDKYLKYSDKNKAEEEAKEWCYTSILIRLYNEPIIIELDP
jgi:hypothetical protein